MKLSSDRLYRLYPDCANDSQTGKTVAVWSAHNHTPHASYPNTAAFLQQYGSEIPAPETTTPEPNWSGFRVAMLQNAGYQRVTLLANVDNNGRLAVSRVETAMAMSNPNVDVIEVLWEQVITAIPLLNRPTATEVGQWNTIATTNNMPFLFKSDGKMQL